MDIKSLRETIGISRESLAVKVGVGISTIYRWENGQTEPTDSKKALLRKALKVKD